MARINKGSHSFISHPHVYPRMERAILPLIPSHSPSPHIAGTHFPSHRR